MLKSTAVVSSMTLISRVLGFVRDIIFANYFGASASVGTDAFFVAFKIPNFMRRLFAEGAFSQAFVPVLSEIREKGSPEALAQFVNRVSGTLGLVLMMVTALGVLGSPLFITVFAPGFLDEPVKFDLASDMLRLTFPYLLFISLTAFAGGILNTFGKFAVPAFTPVLLNLCLIGAAVYVAPMMEQPVVALAWGVLLAGIVQLLFQFPFLVRLGLMPRFTPAPKDPEVRKVGRLMLPALFGVSVTQINLLIDTLIASFLITGSVSWLYYSDRLVEFPLGVFGIALATVILPGLSKQHAAESHDTFAKTLDWAMRWVALVVPAAALGLFILAGPMLATLFNYGEFTAHDVEQASRSLMAYSLGLIGFVGIKVLAPGFYARQDMKTPVKIAVIAMVCNIGLNLALVVPLAHAGLALATSLAACINAGLLFFGLRKAGVYRAQPGWSRVLLQVLLANTMLAGILLWGVPPMADWLAWDATQRAGQLLMWIGLAAGGYFLVLFATGLRPRHLLAPVS